MLVKADILDLPGREKVAAAEAKVVEPQTGKVLGCVPMRPFREWYGGAELKLTNVAIPVAGLPQGRRRQDARRAPGRKCNWSSSCGTRRARS